MADLFGLYLQGGLIETTLLGGAQIDRYGNLNSSVIGDYQSPITRLPGSGGACEIATNVQRILIIMPLKRRAFVERLDFVTSPGHLKGGHSRQEQGLPGQGPQLVITDKALFNFANDEREMQLISLHPAVTVEDVRAEIGWNLCVAANIATTPPPTDTELQYIRQAPL
jgi:glutaconate CoA-transferase subunit B